MQQFLKLLEDLERFRNPADQRAIVGRYLQKSEDIDGAWAIYILSGRQRRRILERDQMSTWCLEISGISEWLFAECFDTTGDALETIALILPNPKSLTHDSLSQWVEHKLLTLSRTVGPTPREVMRNIWATLDAKGRLFFNRLVTGSFKSPVDSTVLQQALAEVLGADLPHVAEKLAEQWYPSPEMFEDLRTAGKGQRCKNYPFAHPFNMQQADGAESKFETTGIPTSIFDMPDEWMADWRHEGVRAQIIKRNEKTYLWSQNHGVITDVFPALMAHSRNLPADTVIDGTILISEVELRRRLARSSADSREIKDDQTAFVAFDLLELSQKDLREQPLHERRRHLEDLLRLAKSGSAGADQSGGTKQLSLFSRKEPETSSTNLRLSSSFALTSTQDLDGLRERCRDHGAAGVLLRKRTSTYKAGVTRDWWHLRPTPLTVRAVLLYVEFLDEECMLITFGAWQGNELVAFAKIEASYTDKQHEKTLEFIKNETVEKIGPIRVVRPELVFEVAFDSAKSSPRHKAGLTVSCARIVRHRKDLKPSQADSLDSIRASIKVN